MGLLKPVAFEKVGGVFVCAGEYLEDIKAAPTIGDILIQAVQCLSGQMLFANNFDSEIFHGESATASLQGCAVNMGIGSVVDDAFQLEMSQIVPNFGQPHVQLAYDNSDLKTVVCAICYAG